MAFLEDFDAGHDVDCKGGDDADPIRASVSAQAPYRSWFVSLPCWTIADSDTQEVPILG